MVHEGIPICILFTTHFLSISRLDKMLPTHQAQRKLQGSLSSMRHTSEKLFSASHMEWRIPHGLLPVINQYWQVLANSLISSAGTWQSNSNARPVKGEPGLSSQTYPHAIATLLAHASEIHFIPHGKRVSFHLIKWEQKVFPLSTMNGPIALFDKRFKHSLQVAKQPPVWHSSPTPLSSSQLNSCSLALSWLRVGVPVFPGWCS